MDKLLIQLELDEPDYLDDGRKAFPSSVQMLLVLFNVDMSWQICLDSGLLPPLDVLNDYLRCGTSDLNTGTVCGKQIKFKIELQKDSSVRKWQPLEKIGNFLNRKFKSTLEPWGGIVKWKPFIVTESDYKCFQEILAASKVKVKLESFGNKSNDYRKWFSQAIKTSMVKKRSST